MPIDQARLQRIRARLFGSVAVAAVGVAGCDGPRQPIHVNEPVVEQPPVAPSATDAVETPTEVPTAAPAPSVPKTIASGTASATPTSSGPIRPPRVGPPTTVNRMPRDPATDVNTPPDSR